METLDESGGRRSLKRKLHVENLDFSSEILQQLSLLNSPLSDRDTVKRAVIKLVELVKNVSSTLENDLMDTIVRCGVVPVLLNRLQLFKDEADAEEGCASILEFLARKVEHPQFIVDAGALPYLLDLLRRHKISTISQPFFGLLRTVADTIYYLARKNTIIQTLVRMEGGIPPLVELLEFNVAMVQIAAAHALETLAFRNDDNKKQIVECNALPSLLLMLQSEDHTTRCVAVRVIDDLVVLSSPDILKDVLQARPLQSVIRLVSSCCFICQRKAVSILTKFAATDSDCKVHISQRGAIPTLVDMLKSPDLRLQKLSTIALWRLAKEEHQQFIVDVGALPYLIDIIRRHKISTISQPFIDLLRNVANVISNFARQNTIIKTLVRMEGGIPPLVELLEFNVTKVQIAAANALKNLAFKDDDNKKQIVECNALPTLLLMLRSEDHTTRCVTVRVIRNLVVLSSPDILKDVLQAGPLQPVICLLSSCCLICQRKAAVILGRFASEYSDWKVHISQRGAIPPFVDMLKSPDGRLRRLSTSALWRLAQDVHNQAGIVHSGGIEPLLNLLDSHKPRVQHNAARALYFLAHNEDAVADIIIAGGFQKLRDGHFRCQRTKDRVAEALNQLEKIQGRVLKHLIYLMCFAEKAAQRTVAIALAYLCSPRDRKTIFIDNNGLELLLDILESPNAKQKGDASAALHNLAARANFSVFDSAPLSTTPQDIYVENVSEMYKMAEDFNATGLKHACIMFMLEKFDELSSKPWYCPLLHRIVPDIRIFFSTSLAMSHPADS